MRTASHPSGRTLRRLGSAAGAVGLDADVVTRDELEPARELPAEVSPP